MRPNRARAGQKRMFRMNQSRKRTRGFDRKNMRNKRAFESKYKNQRRAAVGARSARPGRRLDHFHLRRRYLHGGLAGGAMLGGVGYEDDDDCLSEDPFGDEELLEKLGLDDAMEGSDESGGSVSEGSEGGDNISTAEEKPAPEGPPPLESDDHCHVFFYHSSNTDDVELVERFVSVLESSPNDLKVLQSERDFKSELSPRQNLLLAIPLCQRTVVLCSNDFIQNELLHFEATIGSVMSEETRKQRVLVLLQPDVDLPASLKHQQTVLSLTDPDCFEELARVLTSGSPSRATAKKVEPSAPPLELHERSDTPQKVPVGQLTITEHTKESPLYPSGHVVKEVRACRYSVFEQKDAEAGLCRTYCPHSDIFCPRPHPVYVVPEVLTKRGLQVTPSEFEDIVDSLSEAARVSFFQKAVQCSVPCLYLAAILVTAAISCTLWFLVVGVTDERGDRDTFSASVFWSFMICVVFIPATVALVMLAVIVHLVNYKYLKYRLKIEEFNKKFRETKLILHCRQSFWSCSGRLKLYFIYYDFEQCQQFLYCHVHDNMMSSNGHAGLNGNQAFKQEGTTLKLDRIMKRVNTLTKKFEWDYFEALTTNKLPPIEEREHRKKGMCFCQYVLHREPESTPSSVLEQVKDRLTNMKKTAFSKSHRPKSSRSYSAPTSYKNGTAVFSKSNETAYI